MGIPIVIAQVKIILLIIIAIKAVAEMFSFIVITSHWQPSVNANYPLERLSLGQQK